METRLISDHPDTDSVLGIDIGSVSLSVVQMNISGKILRSVYLFHKGQIRESLISAGKNFDLARVREIACCSAPSLNKETVNIFNTQLTIIHATKELCRKARSILVVGAEKFMVIKFDPDGKFESARTNSSCAAGTGSFLDQQAYRLNLSGIEELCAIALRNKGTIPDIASRCSVFAKTDLIHAQAEGYPIEAICDSLCKGLAKNIADTLFSSEPPSSPILFAGGVSKNQAVIKHLEEQLNTKFLSHEYSNLFGAIGACYLLLNRRPVKKMEVVSSLDEILLADEKKEYYHPPLLLTRSVYPDFTNDESWIFTPVISSHTNDVKVDLYARINKGQEYKLYFGIDIGSTSTKAIITDKDALPIAGFYTYTAGKPFDATRSLLEAVHEFMKINGCIFTFLGVGTTGSGRKFIGKIIHADLVVDEITAHARAAYELNPLTDTIIEIGGQDSKFTLMHEGVVTFSQMNSVCAAGTGSFIEEQARKLDCPLSDYSQRTEGVISPMASDRCTVFMERDINQLLNKGYSVDEILATALHSVMENYLRKVAIEASIGKNICFQGATAKNRSLVAAFEQRLSKEIFVSKYCHLTGALGIALLMHEENIIKSRFRGLEFYRESIKLSNETCLFCNNHCRISMAAINGEQEAYGFMCGRDYETKKRISLNSGFYLLEERKKIISAKEPEPAMNGLKIGIPAALHLFDELKLWQRFFRNLSIQTITSENYMDPLKTGKRLAGAEFCAPIDSFYGHVAYLAGKADYIFLPVILDKSQKPENVDNNYCYYTQFSPPLAFTITEKNIQNKCLSPLLTYSRGNAYVIKQLLHCLVPVFGNAVNYIMVKNAYEEALHFHNGRKTELVNLFKKEFQPEKNISVVLLGRPYVVLSEIMNKGIPDIFSKMGVKPFFQDMIPCEPHNHEEDEFYKKISWHYAARIMEAALNTASTDKLYPVLITAFKCSPDSFIIEYFKKLLNRSGKPYLILQIDEHDSNVGYETRIEAAIRSFRNHASGSLRRNHTAIFPLLPELEKKINGKTLLFPSWDPIVTPFLVANLKRSGIDARILQSNEKTVKKSMLHNTGQCLPVNIITEEFIEYIKNNGLRPERTILWMTKCWVACNLRLYPYFTKSLLDNYGHGFEKAAVYYGDLTHLEISVSTSYYGYFAYLLGGLIRKTGCRIRPYEINKGETDEAIRKSVSILEDAFLGNRPMDNAVSDSLSYFDKIEIKKNKRPGVAIFGDLYVRDNEIMNQDLIHTIEEYGGEVITTPYTDLVKLTIENVLRRQVARGDYLETAMYRVLLTSLKLIEDKYYRKFKKFIGPKPLINPKKLEKHLAKFNINPYHSGESYENILKIFHIADNNPDISLFVQTNPAFCCPALVTEAMTQEIRRITGIPVVTLTYDGTGSYKNDIIAPYLQ